jgi:hypothetical protein
MAALTIPSYPLTFHNEYAKTIQLGFAPMKSTLQYMAQKCLETVTEEFNWLRTE